jgi:hypothetical protein
MRLTEYEIDAHGIVVAQQRLRIGARVLVDRR